MTDDQNLVNTPPRWTQTVSEHESEGQILEAYQRRENDIVVAIEVDVCGDEKYAVTVLPSNWEENNTPIKEYGENGYIWHGNEIQNAKEQVEKTINSLTSKIDDELVCDLSKMR